jgi:hypothetical protein
MKTEGVKEQPCGVFLSPTEREGYEIFEQIAREMPQIISSFHVEKVTPSGDKR